MADLVVLDACTTISLPGCGALDVILALEDYEFFIGPIVLKECEPSCQQTLPSYVDAGLLNEVDPRDIPTSLYLDLLQRFRLGDGETECLVICQTLGCMLASDDGAARRAGVQLYGQARVTGSLGLLQGAVRLRRLAPVAAMEFYLQARRQGAFLPDVDIEFFRI